MQGYLRGFPGIRVQIAKTEHREPCYMESGEGFTKVFRIQIASNVSCADLRCPCTFMEYQGEVHFNAAGVVCID